MAIDLGFSDPLALEAANRALSITDEVIDDLHNEIAVTPLAEDSELYRLARALPPGPISFDRTVGAAIDAARGALDQVSYILRENVPTSPIVFHALLRAALVGSARVVFVLLPADPDTRLRNARVVIAQEARGFTQALESYATFEHLSSLRPETSYLVKARQQNEAIQQGLRPPGDGAVIREMTRTMAEALAITPEYQDSNHEVLREHTAWLWNTYSGAAHTHAWPRLLPGSGADRRIPGDFPGDLFMIVVTAHIAMRCVLCRLESGSANTTAPVLKTE